ncbi:MAG: hypothetical protein ABJA94_06985 [Rhodoglobus sp.]
MGGSVSRGQTKTTRGGEHLMAEIESPGSNHHGDTDWAGIVTFIGLFASGVGLLVYRSVRVVNEIPNGGVVLVILFVGLFGVLWLLFVFYWARGRLRSSAVRRLFPNAALFEIVMTDELAAQVRMAERSSNKRHIPRIWTSTYMTVAATPEGLRFFGGSFRAVPRGFVGTDRLRAVAIKRMPLETRTVTRHFSEIVVATNFGALEIVMLPLRTRFMIPRKLSPQQLADAGKAIAGKLGIPLD